MLPYAAPALERIYGYRGGFFASSSTPLPHHCLSRLLPLVLTIGILTGCGSDRASDPRGVDLDFSRGIDATFNAITHNQNPLERAALWVEFYASIDPADAPRVGDLFKKSIGGQDEVSATLLASWWAQHDPRGALKRAYSWPWDDRKLGTRVVFYEWGRSAPEEALQGLAGLPGLVSGQIQSAGGAFVRGFVDSGAAPSAELASFIEGIDVLKDRVSMIETLISGLSARDGLKATEAYVGSLDQQVAPDLTKQFFRTFVGVAAIRDPDEAKVFVEKYADSVYGKHLRRRLGARWARFHGAEAMEWARALPIEDDRDDVVEHTFRNFVFADRSAATLWMHERHDDPSLEAVLPMFLAVLAKQDPQQAAHWLPRVSDAEKRQRTTEKVVKEWLRTDPEAAMAWVDASELSPRVKRSLSKLLAEKS